MIYFVTLKSLKIIIMTNKNDEVFFFEVFFIPKDISWILFLNLKELLDHRFLDL